MGKKSQPWRGSPHPAVAGVCGACQHNWESLALKQPVLICYPRRRLVVWTRYCASKLPKSPVSSVPAILPAILFLPGFSPHLR